MDLQPQPLALDLARLDGLSQRLVASHHENNYTGAVKRLDAIRSQLAGLDWSAAPVFVINGLKREELIAADSAWLHELYFAGLGGDGALPDCGLSIAMERDFGSVDRWRLEFTALAKAMGGGSGWALLSWSSREGRLVNHWASSCTASTVWTSAARPRCPCAPEDSTPATLPAASRRAALRDFRWSERSLPLKCGPDARLAQRAR